MPALKMTIKSQSNLLRVYSRKSAKILKCSHPHIKSSINQTMLDSSCSSPWNVSAQNIEIIEANDCQDTFIGNTSQLLKLLSSSPDSTSFREMEFLMASCPPNLEKFFSQGFEQSDIQFIPTFQTDLVEGEQPHLPHLVTDEADDKDCLSEFQSCSSFDCFVSDKLKSLPFDGGVGFSDMTYEHCPDYELMNSDTLLDMAERCLLFPLLDNPVDSMGFNNGECFEKPMMDSSDPCMHLTIHQLTSPDQEATQICFPCDLEEKMCFNALLPCSKLTNSTSPSSSSPLTIMGAEKRKSVTLVLDLDETLVHSTLEHCDDADFSFPVFFDMKQHTVYVKRRPFLQTFLERVALLFRVVIFTASQSIYAERLLNILDPDRKLISQCFYRDSCIFSEGTYTKDLTVLGIDLAKVAIIDNSPQVYRLQVNNGIPIKSWFDDRTDQALNSLLPFLETLADVDDVRMLISARFGNKEEQQLSLQRCST